MDKEELELKERLKEEKKAILQERKRKREESKNIGTHQNKIRSLPQKAIYVSNIPLDKDITKLREELIQDFGKFGTFERNQDDEIKCKLYKDGEGKFKGDALIIYTREEYAILAIEMMDKYIFKGNQLKVEMAHFDEKKPTDKERSEEPRENHEKENTKRRKIDIQPEKYTSTESRKDRTLVLANIIDIYQDLDSGELQEIEEDIADGCQPFGHILFYTLNSDKGEMHITFTHRDDALKCRQTMNGRFFDGRKVLAYMLDEEDLSDNESESNHEVEELIGDNDDFVDDI